MHFGAVDLTDFVVMGVPVMDQGFPELIVGVDLVDVAISRDGGQVIAIVRLGLCVIVFAL